MRIRHRDAIPDVHPEALVMPTAVLAGRVRIAARARILYGAVLDAEGSRIEIGETSIISENAVLRATAEGDGEHAVVIGDHVLVGPHATLLGCRLEPCTFIATGATVLHGAVVKRGAVVAVGALVHARCVIPEEFFVPPNAVAIGDPVALYGPHDGEKLVAAIKEIGFSRTAFGAQTQGRDRASLYRDVTEIRSREYAAHADDVVLDEPPA